MEVNPEVSLQSLKSELDQYLYVDIFADQYIKDTFIQLTNTTKTCIPSSSYCYSVTFCVGCNPYLFSFKILNLVFDWKLPMVPCRDNFLVYCYNYFRPVMRYVLNQVTRDLRSRYDNVD